MMNNHTMTIQKVQSYSDRTPAHHYQAECSCGWVSNQAWLEATVRRADNHRTAAVITSTIS